MEPQEFRAYARKWLEENAPPAPPERLPITPIEVMTVGQRDYLQDWQRKCYRAGLIGVDYPVEYGGHGQSGLQRIANQELERSGVPYLLNIVGLNMVAPTIMKHGNEEQKRKFLPGCLWVKKFGVKVFRNPVPGLTCPINAPWQSRMVMIGSSMDIKSGPASGILPSG